MKRLVLNILLCELIILVVVGCGKKEESRRISIDELNTVNEQIVEYFSNHDFNNYSFSYIDDENMVVIVGLEDISDEGQKWFKENVVDSELIKFVYGEKAIPPKNLITYDGKSCEYVGRYTFKGYYNFEMEDRFFIIVDRYLIDSPMILQLDNKFKDINFIEGESYEFTFKDVYRNLNTTYGNAISKDTFILKVEHIDKNTDEQFKDPCILK